MYILMILVCGIGLTLILERGMELSAPPDLSGNWQVRGARAVAGLGDRVTVEQSGRYVRMTFAKGRQIDLKLADAGADAETPTTTATTRRRPALEFRGDDWTLAARGTVPAGPLECELRGPEPHTFTLVRPGSRARSPAPATTAPSTTQPNAP
jgi:hypothetical protein